MTEEKKPRGRGTHFPDLPPLPDPSKPVSNITEAVKKATETGDVLSQGIVRLRTAAEEFLAMLRKKSWERRS